MVEHSDCGCESCVTKKNKNVKQDKKRLQKNKTQRKARRQQRRKK